MGNSSCFLAEARVVLQNRTQKQLIEVYKEYSGSWMLFPSLIFHFTLFLWSILSSKTLIYLHLSGIDKKTLLKLWCHEDKALQGLHGIGTSPLGSCWVEIWGPPCLFSDAAWNCQHKHRRLRYLSPCLQILQLRLFAAKNPHLLLIWAL